MRGRCNRDEELRPVRVRFGAIVSHRDHAWTIEPETGDDLVLKGRDRSKVSGESGDRLLNSLIPR
jgi:hypothetical protein